MQDCYNDVFSQKSKVLFVFAHPDDAEIYCGGIIARLVADNKIVKLIKSTTGNKGSRQDKISEDNLARIRESEDNKALSILGLAPSQSINLNLGDGEVESNLETIEKFVREIRLFKPDIVVTHNPEKKLIRDLKGNYYVNHRDHRNTAINVVDACYPFSRDTLFFPEHFNEGLNSHSVTEFLFVDSWGDEDLVYIDITDFANARTNAIAAHASQYTQEHAQSSTDYFAPLENGKRFEQFRHVIAD